MRLKWKLRLYYGALLVVLLGLVAAATGALVLQQFRLERERVEIDAAARARRLLEERLAAVDSAVSRVARDTDLRLLAQRDLAGSRDETLVDWVPLAERLAKQHDLALLKILDGEGRVLSSAHWPAAYDVADSRGLVLALEPGGGTRLVRERDAAHEFLAIESPRWVAQSRRFAVIGGERADSLLEAELSLRAGLPVRFEWRDATAHPGMDPGWIPLPASPAEASAGLRLRVDRVGGLLDLRWQLLQVFLAALLAGASVAWLLGWWISSRVTRPLERLAEGVAVLGEGGMPSPIRAEGSSEVRELVGSFNRMAESLAESRERLRRAERIAAWGEVARRVAHEIKNSLAPIQLSVDTVARSLHTGKGDLRALVDESASTVRGEVEALTRLVNAFNEMARLPEPVMRPQRLTETWERASFPFRETLNLSTSGLEDLPPLAYDQDQIRQALHNLLRNSQEAGATRVRLEARPPGPRGFRVVLADDGPGIAAGDLERVFEPYFTRKPEGTGLGLAIVYKICTDHGWSVRVRSPAVGDGDADRPGVAFEFVIPPRSAEPVDPGPSRT